MLERIRLSRHFALRTRVQQPLELAHLVAVRSASLQCMSTSRLLGVLGILSAGNLVRSTSSSPIPQNSR